MVEDLVDGTKPDGVAAVHGIYRGTYGNAGTLRPAAPFEAMAISLVWIMSSCDKCTLQLNLLEPGGNIACPIDWSRLPTPEVCRDDEPALEFTSVPALGSTDDLSGEARGVGDDLCVLTYICVAGRWWVKPTEAEPFARPGAGCQFSVDITTGGNDEQADEIRAFLVPYDVEPGVNSLPLDDIIQAEIGETRGVSSCDDIGE